jgi:hypothetical protein
MPQHQSPNDEGDQKGRAHPTQPLRRLLIGAAGRVADQGDTDTPCEAARRVEHEETSPRHATHPCNSWHDGPEERGKSADEHRPATPFA